MTDKSSIQNGGQNAQRLKAKLGDICINTLWIVVYVYWYIFNIILVEIFILQLEYYPNTILFSFILYLYISHQFLPMDSENNLWF